MIKDLLRKSRKNLHMLLVWNEYRRIKEKVQFHKFSDEEFIKKLYKEKLGKELNLKEPKTFTEKLNWIKLYYRNPLMVKCADKYKVREYIKDCGYENLLNPLVAVYENVAEIDYEALPEKFVLKGTHGSGWNIICTDKKKLNTKMYSRIMRSWLKQNIYYSGREWVYDEIKPRIVCEKYIETNGEDLKDYKIFCFSGEPTYIQVDGERYTAHKRVYYNTNWERQEFQYGDYGITYEAQKPEMLEKMLKIAKDLSQPFQFARVDLYNVKGMIIFGEITFFPDAGFAKFTPKEMDERMGMLLKLPKVNNIVSEKK